MAHGGSEEQGYSNQQGLPALSPTQLEDMALVLYSLATEPGWSQQYYVPVCPPPGTISAKGNTWICNGANWYWTPNDPDLSDPGADQNVQAQYIFAAGTSGPIGNRPGLQYVRNAPTDPWYDSNLQQGVRDEMK